MTSRRLVGGSTLLLALAALLVVPLAGQWLALLVGVTGVAVAIGSEVMARLHPDFGSARGRKLDGFWIGPGLSVVAAALAASQAEPNVARVLGLSGAAVLALLLVAQDRELAGQGGDRLLSLAYAVVLYLGAFALFVTLYSQRDQVVLSTLGVGWAAALLGLALYRPTGAPIRRAWLYAGLSGLCLAEMVLVAEFWISGGLLGGAFLLLFFYVVAGLVQAHFEGSLNSRLVAEYTVVGALGLGLIIWASPWRG
jgi:Protein of unknown function (DUF5656)